MFNLSAIAIYLEQNKLWDTSFREMDRFQITDLSHAILRAAEHNTIPYIQDKTLYLPPNVAVHFKYWAGGQPLIDTLKQLNASPEMIEKYCPHKDNKGLKRSI
jgi:hypothetical protein